MAASRLVEVTDKEISETKINSVPRKTKYLCKNTKQSLEKQIRHQNAFGINKIPVGPAINPRSGEKMRLYLGNT